MIAEEVCGLSTITQQQLRDVFSRHPRVESVVLYGSRAMGTFKSGSDIDLTVGGSSLTHQDLLKISAEIDDLLLPYKTDLSLFDKIDHDDLKQHIKRAGVSLFP